MGLPSAVLPFVHQMGLVAVNSFGVQVLADGRPKVHLVQVGQTFPLVEVIPLRVAVVLVETVEGVPLLVVEMFEMAGVPLRWKGTGGRAWTLGHILQCS